MDEALRQKLLYVKGLKDIKCDVPGFKGQLEDYQRVGVAFCVLGKTVILGDPCGSGKTVMSIASDLKLREMGTTRRTLVVTLSDKRRDWRDEYQRFSSLNTYMIDGSKNDRVSQWLTASVDTGVTIASYEQVRADVLISEKDNLGHKVFNPTGLLHHLHYDLFIFDEASIFKTWDTTLCNSLRFLREKCNPVAVIAATASAIEKTVEDLFSVMNKVYPPLFPDYNQFSNYFVVKRWIDRFVGGRKRGGFWKVVGYQNQDQLAAIIAPYHIKRDRNKIFTTKRVRKVRYVEMKGTQSKRYFELRESVSRGSSRQDMLQVFREMEYIVDTMAHFDKDDHTSAKIDSIMDSLTGELRDEKVLIFSKHHRPLEELRLRLAEEKIEYMNYTGRETVDQREDDRQRFLVDPNLRVCLMTTAAEKGKNFHSAHYIMFLNHIRNPVRIGQLIGRIDRGVAQTSDFICSIHYACRDTFEEDIVPKLDKESELMYRIFGGQDDTVELLSDDQLYDLIKNGRIHAE